MSAGQMTGALGHLGAQLGTVALALGVPALAFGVPALVLGSISVVSHARRTVAMPSSVARIADDYLAANPPPLGATLVKRDHGWSLVRSSPSCEMAAPPTARL